MYGISIKIYKCKISLNRFIAIFNPFIFYWSFTMHAILIIIEFMFILIKLILKWWLTFKRQNFIVEAALLSLLCIEKWSYNNVFKTQKQQLQNGNVELRRPFWKCAPNAQTFSKRVFETCVKTQNTKRKRNGLPSVALRH